MYYCEFHSMKQNLLYICCMIDPLDLSVQGWVILIQMDATLTALKRVVPLFCAVGNFVCLHCCDWVGHQLLHIGSGATFCGHCLVEHYYLIGLGGPARGGSCV